MVVGARRPDELNRLVAEIEAAGGRAVALPGDVQNESYANQLVGLATRQFGGLDIAFNNAATMGELGSIVDMSRENWTRTLETNLTSAFLGAKYRDSGDARSRWRLVDLHVDLCGPYGGISRDGGVCGKQIRPDRDHAGACSRSSASAGIRVNALLPGGTDTEMAREMNNTERKLRPSSGACTHSSVSQSRRRSQGRPFISHRMHQASRPASPCSPMGACRSPEA